MSLMLILAGETTREKQWSISNTKGNLICRYNFHYFLAHDVGFASNKKWFVKDEGGERKISYEEARKILPNLIPRLGLWEGYSLLVIFFCIFIGVLFTSSASESIDWLLNAVESILFITVLYFGGNYLVQKFKK